MVTKNDQTTPEVPADVADSDNVVSLNPAPAEGRTTEKIVGFVKRHPVLTVAGGVAAGVVVSALLPRKAGRKMLGRAMNLAEVAGAATAMFGRETSEKADRFGLSARRKARAVASRADETHEKAAARLEKFGLAALAAANALGRATAQRAEKIGDAAAGKRHQIIDIASGFKHRIKH